MELPPSSGADVQRLREQRGLTRAQFGAPAYLNADRIGDIEDGTVKNIKPGLWLLLLIVHDRRFRAKWLNSLSDEGDTRK